MIKKHGVTLTMLAIVIIVLMILAGVITVSTYSTISFSRLTTWANELGYIQDAVDEHMNSASVFSDIIGTISLDTSELGESARNVQFEGENINGTTVELYILDLGKLNITDTVYGNRETEQDVYAMSQTTGRVYYVAGIEVKGEVYYTLTNDLEGMYGMNSSVDKLTSVVFVPSKIGYTNEAVSITIKVPSNANAITISTTNSSINISSQSLVNGVYEYQVNTNKIVDNYTVTVSYNNGTETIEAKYEVSGYEVVNPVLTIGEKENNSLNVTATDASGIKYLKYEYGIIENENAKEYFASNGKDIRNGNITLKDNISNYTIYAEDSAGNFTVEYKQLWIIKQDVNGKNTVVTNGVQTLNIGDKVGYIATSSDYSGTWQILGASNDGDLMIVSTDIVNSSFSLTGKDGYKDAVSLLDSACLAYGAGTGAKKVRSITVEDINNIMNYDPQIEKYGAGEIYEYGNKIIYSWDGTAKPYYVYGDIADWLLTEHTSFEWYDGTLWQQSEKSTTATTEIKEVITSLKSTYYSYTGADRIGSQTQAYKLIFKNALDDTDLNYCLASQYINFKLENVEYGIFSVSAGEIKSNNYLYTSDGNSATLVCGVRPVVLLKDSITLTGSSLTGWEITE